ncbi:EGFR adapter protein-like isoform X1 [Diorhabda carinulata]|uniref:EGFR adapter protein-like isoform X1 n=2 Tax=Diorhabda carinulata TaxID=1163345 RepID=UPI0025A2645C|nr:EGFR adapter protein-like isoform X1 [Diorhabda carinulata]
MMGRLSKSTPSIRVNYRKLVDEYSSSCDSLKIMPALPDFFTYSCRHCGQRQTLQTEELNSIVGNAFKMAYAAQLQKQTTFQDVIASQTQQDKVVWTKDFTSGLKKEKPSAPPQTLPKEANLSEMDVQLSDASTLRLSPPSSIPGLKTAQKNKFVVNSPNVDKNINSQLSTPSSDESNSPTEMNSYKRMAEKPPLIKRIAMGLTGNSNNHSDEDSCPLVNDNTSSIPGSPTNRPLSGGYVNESEESKNKSNNTVDNLKNEIENNSNLSKRIDTDTTVKSDFKSKRMSQLSSSSSSTGPPNGQDSNLIGFTTPTPPPLPERTDSLNNKEEGELRLAPWFQAGIPREIALEILGQEPVGAFMVRESTSKPGCFALSLRVPRSFQPTGIAHYLIVRANKGYKIKGFTKEFTSLTSLITHHSVMPELLPCPLSLSRYHPSFVKSDSKRDFADIDLDPDYNTLADFRKMMADLNV